MTEISDERLLPCPFCGGAAKLATSQIPREYACRIKCDGCHIEIIRTDSWYEITAKEKAVTAWNRRAPASAGVTPEGWVLAPEELTEEMWKAFFDARDDEFPHQMEKARAEGKGWKGLPAVVWDAMLAARPAPPVEG